MAIFKECSMSKDGILMNLAKGLEAEHRAWDLCDQILKIVVDADDKAQIERIKADEERHIKITENLIAVVKGFYTEEYQKKSE